MNEAIFYFFYNFAHKSVLVDQAAVFAALYLPFIVAFLAFAYLIFFRRSLREFIFVFFTAGIAGLISKVLKVLIFDALNSGLEYQILLDYVKQKYL